MKNKFILYVVGGVLVLVVIMGKKVKDISSWFKPIYNIPASLQKIISKAPIEGAVATKDLVGAQYVDMATVTGLKSDKGVNYLDQHHDTRDIGGGLKIVQGGGYAYTDTGQKQYASQSVLDKAKLAWKEFYN